MLNPFRNWLDIRAAKKDGRRFRAAERRRNAVVVAEKINRAGELARSGNKELAADILDHVLALYPEEAADLPDTAAIMLSIGRCDEAEKLLLRGMQRFPDNRTFREFYGRVADVRGDVAERLRRWHKFRRRYPAYRMAFIMEAKALLAAGDIVAAEKVWAEAIYTLPEDIDLAIEHAGVAEARQDWQEALQRWMRVRDHFANPVGARRTSRALSQLGRSAEAKDELAAARRRYPLDPGIIEEQAVLAERSGDVETALARWDELRATFPHLPKGYSEPAKLLRAAGNSAAADALEKQVAERNLTGQ